MTTRQINVQVLLYMPALTIPLGYVQAETGWKTTRAPYQRWSVKKPPVRQAWKAK